MSNELVIPCNAPENIPVTLKRAEAALTKGLAVGPVDIALRRPESGRSNQANRLMWKLLNDISKQVEWCGQYHPSETWKDLITALMKKQTLLPGLDGGFVAIGTSTRKMRKSEFSDLIECIYSVGAERNVQWSADTSTDWDSYKEAQK